MATVSLAVAVLVVGGLGVFAAGMVLGYVLGGNAARWELAEGRPEARTEGGE